VFSQHAAGFQALAGQAAAFNTQFTQNLTAGATSYADIEASIASFLQGLVPVLPDFPATIASLLQGWGVPNLPLGPYAQATILWEGWVVESVIANPRSLPTPLPYGEALLGLFAYPIALYVAGVYAEAFRIFPYG